MADYQPEQTQQFSTSVSVLVPMRNEETNIENCLNSLLQQDYSPSLYEVIIIDDHSDDESPTIVRQIMAQTDKNVRLLKLSSTETQGKKAAIAYAMKQSSGNLVVTVDADCEVPQDWLNHLAGFYEKYKPKMILGPVDFNIEIGMFQKFQNLEFLGLMAVTAGSAEYDKPIMCNGANLAYEREAFEQVNGFEGVDNMPSGDDVFLMLKINEKWPGSIQFIKSKEAIVKTKPQKELKSFIEQRKRWLSKRTGYKNQFLISTALINYFTNLACLIGLIVVITPFFIPSWIKIIFGIFIFTKSLSDYILLSAACEWFNKKNLLKPFFISELFVILYVSLIGIFGNSGKYVWKNRSVRQT